MERCRPSPRKSDPAGQAAVYAPLYRQIKDLIVQGLQRGEWKPGEMIPSEIDLAARFQVSQGTVRKAVDELSTENLLVRRQGKGTFVATHHEPRAQFRFLRVVPDDHEPTPATSSYLDCKRTRATGEIARHLAVQAKRSGRVLAPAVELRRHAGRAG